MYHDFEVKYHDFGLPIVKSMLFFCKRLRIYTLHNSKKAVTAD